MTGDPPSTAGPSYALAETRPGRHIGDPFPAEPLLCARSRVRAEWVDYNDHMNVGFYLLAFDQALDVAYDEWLGFGADYARRLQMGPFALQTHMHFLRELRRDAPFEIRMLLLDLDHKRIHYLLTMHALESGELAASSEQLSMNVDHASRRSAPFPDATFARFSEMMAAHRDLPRPPQVGQPIGIRRA